MSAETWCFMGCKGTTRLLWSIRAEPEGFIPSERVESAGEGRAENTGDCFVDGVGEAAGVGRVDMEAGLLFLGGTKQMPVAISRGTPSVFVGTLSARLRSPTNRPRLIRPVAELEELRLRKGEEERLPSASSSPAS